jgi:hypothetical protein
VAGDTIYNMIRLGEGHIEDGDRPKYPHKIIKTRVLINPFPDIEPRQTITQVHIVFYEYRYATSLLLYL